MKTELLHYLTLSNPWLTDPTQTVFSTLAYISRTQIEQLLKPAWDNYITILTGPRQAGKTTLGRYLSQQLLKQGRYEQVLYLNCDDFNIRTWLTGAYVVTEIQQLLQVSRFILFVDEIQRLENPGLWLKAIYDLQLPIKLIATGSSQLEIKSKVQEHLTGRQLESLILPLSYTELATQLDIDNQVIYGCYPKIVTEPEKILPLASLYQNYINKDIIEILKIRNPDTLQQLLTLMAHSSGQLVNYQQLATDCRTSAHTIQHYLSVLENSYVLAAVKPFVGNKRTEITSNPIYYFIDNGFRNQALNNFAPLTQRTDAGLLIQSAVFQELYKFKIQNYLQLSIHYWRTKGGAEVDFVLYKNEGFFVPIEVKYRNLTAPTISRSFRSFLQAYQPKVGIYLTKDYYNETVIDNCRVVFLPFSALAQCLEILKSIFVAP